MTDGPPCDDVHACAEALDALHSLLDGELHPKQAAEVEAHLDACLPCGLEADTYRALKRAIRECGNGLDPTTLERVRGFARELTEG